MRNVFTKFVVSATMLLLLSFVSFTARATHISGADFNYQCVGQDSFWITLNLFRDCTGIDAPRRAKVTFTSSCGQSFEVRLTKQNGRNGTEISQLCPGVLNQSTCSGGTLPGMQHHIYGGLVVLSPRCDYWTMQWGLCCRNATENLIGQPEMLVETTMYSQTDSCNNSPVFNAQPILYVCLNQNVDYNFSVTETDGDSLIYRFIEPLDQMVGGVAQPVVFTPGYTYTNPIPGITLNSATGQLQFTPTLQGNFVLAVEVCEYDYVTGALIGCIVRDIQFVVIPCSNYAPVAPINGISSFTGTGSLVASDSVLVCEGNTFNFDIVFTDQDIGDIITLTTNVTQVFPGAVTIITNGNPATVNISGVATAGMPSLNTFVVNADDGSCPIPATAIAAYNIIVQPIPIVDAGPDQTVCKANLPINIAGSVLNATGAQWSGNGVFGGALDQLSNTYMPTAAELSAGVAQLTFSSTGNQNCNAIVDTLLLNLVSFNASATASGDDISCFGGMNGEARVVYSGGVSPISLEWNTNPVQTTDTIRNLDAGTYTVTLTDGNGCDTVLGVTITEPSQLSTSLTSIINVNCTGGNDGSATVIVSGGVAPYTYLWSASAQNQITATGHNLFAGTHQVTVTDASGCSVVESVSIVQPNYPMTLNVNTTDVSCYGDDDGSATATPAGGTAPYNFYWSPNAVSGNPLLNISGGVYSVTVVDNSGMCVVQTGIVVNEPNLITGVNNSTPVLCNSETNGVVSFVPNGGTAPFIYQWGASAGNQTTVSVSNLGAGIYPLTLTDAHGCVFDTTVALTEPDPIVTTVNQSLITCNGGGNGSATLSITGGVFPYVTTWNTNPVVTGTSVSNLSSGNYNATIVDFNGCDTVVSISVIEPTPLTGTIVSQTDVSCTGGFNGEVTISGSGGVPPYSYLWGANAQNDTNATVDSLFAGNYSVTITDDLGCTFTQSVTITQPVFALSVNLTVTDISCNGLTDGVVNAMASGGTAPYSYSWSPGNQNTGLIANLPVSSNTVTVTDNSGQCIVQTGILVNEPQPISTVGVMNPVLCFGENTGNISLNGYGGVRPFSYIWDANTGNQVDSVVNNLFANTYSFSITDANGCLYDSTVTVTQPSELEIEGLRIEPLCNGDANGSIEAVASGGEGTYTYLWDVNAGSQNTSLAIGLATGNYLVSVTDGNNCVQDSLFNLIEPTPLTVGLVDILPVGCYGDSTGEISVSGAGGAGPYEYDWNTSSGLEGSSSVVGLAAGTYTVTILDTNGCFIDTTLAVTQPQAALSLSSNIENVACFGDSTGTISAIPTGGTSPYSYQWDSLASFQVTQMAIAVFPDSFSVVVTDSNGCQDSLVALVTEPNQPVSVLISSTDVLCNGDSTGTATVSGQGGTGPYTYQWDISANSQTSNLASNLPLGVYHVTVTDNLGCEEDTVVQVVEPLALAITGNPTMPNCKNGSDGSIEVIGSGGIGAYSFLWDSNAFNQTTDIATGLSANSYSVTLSDANGCVQDSLFTVAEPTLLQGIISNEQPVGCFGDSSGIVELTGMGGTAPYTYQWSVQNTSVDSGYIDGLWAGTHPVTVTDANGCQFDTSFIMTQPTAQINISANIINVACYGDSTATAEALVSGGTAPYIYQWDAYANNQTTIVATGLFSGSFQVVVTDSNGCQDSLVALVTEPNQPVSILTSSTDVLCNGDSTGTATVSGQGGTGPYTYQWGVNANSQISNMASILPLGGYHVTVTDNLGCEEDTVVQVEEPEPVGVSGYSIQNVNCNAGVDGQAEVFPQGGVAPYVFLWSPSANSQTSALATGLSADTHLISFTDSKGCTFDTLIVVDEPLLALTLDSAQIPVSCFGGNDGVAIAVASGGTYPYNYIWNGIPVIGSDSLFNVGAGNNSVLVVDANGCLESITVEVLQPTLLQLNEAQNVSVDCYGNLSGSATVVGTGGVSPYQYLWPFNASYQTDSMAIQLGVGSYQVTVTDTNGCSAETIVVINQPQAPLANNLTVIDPLCKNDTNGIIATSPSGGTAPYSYQWSSGQTGSDTLSQIGAGSYFVWITDSNGCQIQSNVMMNEPSLLEVNSITSQPVLCYGGGTGSASINLTGGTLPYTYQWSANSGNQTTAAALSLNTGTYGVTATDFNGCVVDSTILVMQPADSLKVDAVISNVSCYGGNNGEFTINAMGGTAPYSYSWGVNVINVSGLTASGLVLGNYQAYVVDNNGCRDTVMVNIDQPNAPIAVSATSLNASCFGFADGQSTLSVSGGTPPYLCDWDANANYQIGSTAVNLIQGGYWGFVTDSLGCTDSVLASINHPAPIALQVSGDDTVCTQTNFNIGAYVTGGDGNYSYQWNNGLPNFDNHVVSTVASNVFTVSVTDGIGCPGQTADINITVFQIELDSLNTWSSGDICAGESSDLFANYNSQFGGFSYQWSHGLGTGNGPKSVSPSQTTIYEVTVTDQCGSSVSDFVVVNLKQDPVVNLQSIVAQGCGPLEVLFEDQIQDSGVFTYFWDFGDGSTSNLESPTHIFTQEGSYSISVVKTSANGCEGELTGSSSVIVNPTPEANGVADFYVKDISQPTINFTDQSIGADTITWKFSDIDESDDRNTSYTYPDTGSYLVLLTAQNNFGCTSEFELTVLVENQSNLSVPNAFTPNSDGGNGGSYDASSLSNEVFYARAGGVVEFHMYIYNRWGELIFESTDIKTGWDGYYRGELSPQDVYVWKIEASFDDGQQVSEVGNLTLIR